MRASIPKPNGFAIIDRGGFHSAFAGSSDPLANECRKRASSGLFALKTRIGPLDWPRQNRRTGNMTDSAIAGSRSQPLESFWRAAAAWQLTAPGVQAGATVTLGILLLLPAFWNGYPFMFFDTGAYLLQGVGHVFMPERSPVYSLFLAYAGGGSSLWLIAILQAGATAFVIVESLRLIAPKATLGRAGLIGGALVVLTGLPFVVGEIEPDCFAALTVMSVYLLSFHGEALRNWCGSVLVGLLGFFIGAHPSHLLLAGGLIGLLAAYDVLRHFRLPALPNARLARPAWACLLGVFLVIASNYALTGAVFISRAGPSFVFARLLQDGLVERVLDETCPQSHYRLCAYRGVLPRTADQWLWNRYSPFFRLGRFTGPSLESSRIIWATLERYPLLQVEAASAASVRQFGMFRTGDQIEPQQWVLSGPLNKLIPAQYPAYIHARQQRTGIDFKLLNLIDVGFGWLSLVALAALLALQIRRGAVQAALLPGFVFAALIGNAVICGTCSNPHDRYQSRVIWLAPFALMLTGPNSLNFALRGGRESGTRRA
jgi:hypothetical protein